MEELALKIATEAHRGQKRWDGQPYITHPIAVAAHMVTMKEKVVALLHDVVEDTSVTLDDLRIYFPSDITDAVEAITKENGEEYFEYLDRVATNQLARLVKIEDIKHNLQTLRRGSMRDKYLLAIKYLELKEKWMTT